MDCMDIKPTLNLIECPMVNGRLEGWFSLEESFPFLDKRHWFYLCICARLMNLKCGFFFPSIFVLWKYFGVLLPLVIVVWHWAFVSAIMYSAFTWFFTGSLMCHLWLHLEWLWMVVLAAPNHHINGEGYCLKWVEKHLQEMACKI